MENEACIIVGVPIGDVAQFWTQQTSVKRFDERTGEPYQKKISELVVQIAGKVVYQDEEELVLDNHETVESFVDAKIQEVVGKFGVIQVFREYDLLGVDQTCLEQGQVTSPHRLAVPLDLAEIVHAVTTLETCLSNAFGGEHPKVNVYLCGDDGEFGGGGGGDEDWWASPDDDYDYEEE